MKDIRRVPAKEFITRFGEFCEDAQREPIGITNHGRMSVVLISSHDYEQYVKFKAQLDNRTAVLSAEMPNDDIAVFEAAKYGKLPL